MSVLLFNAVPAGSVEVLTDENNLPHFKRADLGWYLGIININATYRDVETKSRGVIWPHPQQRGNDHDAFVGLEAALEIVVRSRKPKAVELVKWLTRKGVKKIAEEHQKAIDEKDMQIALLDDDLAGSQDLVRQLEYNNIGLQGEIRAKDQELAVSRPRYVPLLENAE